MLRLGLRPFSRERVLRSMSHSTPTPIQAPSLREWVLSQSSPSQPPSSSTPKSFKIVDVRDDDYMGGHIPGCINVPSRQFSFRVDGLVDELKDHEAIVFTCALSQQRGPTVISRVLNLT